MHEFIDVIFISKMHNWDDFGMISNSYSMNFKSVSEREKWLQEPRSRLNKKSSKIRNFYYLGFPLTGISKKNLVVVYAYPDHHHKYTYLIPIKIEILCGNNDLNLHEVDSSKRLCRPQCRFQPNLLHHPEWVDFHSQQLNIFEHVDTLSIHQK